MPIRSLVLVVVWTVACLAGLGAFLFAQNRQDQVPAILSGADIGFRPDAVQRNPHGVSGTLLVRINGQWVETQPSVGPRPAANEPLPVQPHAIATDARPRVTPG